MVVKVLIDQVAMDFLKDLTCSGCHKRVSYNGEGQAGIKRVICYYCDDCDILYQMVIEKKGELMFEDMGQDGKCVLVPDKTQNKCNLCSCALTPR